MFPDITRDDIFRLETPRLWLRWIRAADTAVAAGFADWLAATHIGRATSLDGAATLDRHVLNARGAMAAGRALVLGVTLKTKARTLVGLVGAESVDMRDIAVGFVVAPASRGRGFGTEALSALVDTVFSLTEARAVVATGVGVGAARRVLQKCGFAGAPALEENAFRLTRAVWTARERPRRMPSMSQQAR